MDLSKYRHLYVSETQENLERLSSLLVDLEADPGRKDRLDTVFRLFHSIKGMSGTMGYTPLFDLAHRLEDLMDLVRRGSRPLDAETIDLLLGGVDRMGRWVTDVEAERPLEVDEDARELGEKALATSVAPAPAPEAAAGPGEVVVRASLDPACADPGVRGFLLYRKLKKLGEVVACDPAEDVLRSGAFAGGIALTLRTEHPPERVAEFVATLPEWLEVEVGAGEQLLDPGDSLELSGDLELLGPPPRATAPAPPPKQRQGESPRAAAAIVRAPRAARTIRIRTDWLDGLLDRVGDLLIVSQRLWNLNRQNPDPAMSDALGELANLLAGLRGDAMTARMTPVSVLTQRLPRVVRDLARQADKAASLVVRGEDQQLDRAIIEGLDAPLTHMLRNAIEHGIEAPADREQAGKPPTGVLTLSCERVRDEIVVSLRDDGRGVDVPRMVERAVASGMLDRSRAEALGERDLARLLAHPGLSALDEAGALAGRGVGMDAVVDSVAALGGRVTMETVPGEGTTVHLRLPRTPGISRLLLVEADGQVFGLPLGRVLRTDVFAADEVEREGGAAYVLHGDDRCRLHRLRHLLGLAPAELVGRFPGVVFASEQPYVVAVDRVVGQQDAVIKPLGPLLERIEGLQGVTIDPVGHPVFVVDVGRFAVVS